MKPFYLLMLTAALACAGCCKDKSDNPPPQKLTVEQTDCTLGAFEERTATVSLSASADWTVSVVYDGADSEADAAWLAVTPANGAAGEQRLTLSADNNFRNAPRTARLDLACGGANRAGGGHPECLGLRRHNGPYGLLRSAVRAGLAVVWDNPRCRTNSFQGCRLYNHAPNQLSHQYFDLLAGY